MQPGCLTEFRHLTRKIRQDVFSSIDSIRCGEQKNNFLVFPKWSRAFARIDKNPQ